MNKKKQLFELRRNYTQGGLSLGQVLPDPLAQFNLWFDQAVFAELPEPNAMTLATANKSGKVSARVVLLKEVNQEGFVFFSNYHSRKAQDISENPYVALVFSWLEFERQVRVEGPVKKISEKESDIYFQSRPRESQIGAWASDQSTQVDTKEILFEKFEQLQQQYHNKPVPRPPHWGGYVVTPLEIEFWQGRPGRMHDRILYMHDKTTLSWERKRLAP